MNSKENERVTNNLKTDELIEPCFVQKVWWDWLRKNPSALSVESIPVFLTFRGASASIVEKAFRKVLERQVVLRFQFVETALGLRAMERDIKSVRVRRITLTHLPANNSAITVAHRLISKMRARSLSATNGKLIDVLVIDLPDNVCLFFANFHHLIFDGNSIGRFSLQISDILNSQNCDGAPRVFTRNDYFQWAERERNFLLSPGGQSRVAHWKKWIEEVPALSAPNGAFDLSCAAGTLISYSFSFSSDLIQKIKLLADKLKVSEFTVWLAIYASTLHRWSGRERFGIKAVGNLRISKKLSEAVGLFTCIDPMEINLKTGETFSVLVGRVRGEYFRSLASRLPPLPDEFGIGIRERVAALFNFMPLTETGAQSRPTAQQGNLWPSLSCIKKQEVLSIPFAAIQLKVWPAKYSLGGVFELNSSLISESDQKKLLETFSNVVREIFLLPA
jgi:hypothetical protein